MDSILVPMKKDSLLEDVLLNRPSPVGHQKQAEAK
jgi:hypothetical protein